MKVKEYFTEPLNGFFKRLGELFPEKYPWANDMCDVLYLARSGNKTAAPLLSQIPLYDELPAEYGNALDILARLIDKKFGTSWQHLYDITMSDYNPIENYNMLETETPNITRATDMETNADGESNASGYGFNSDAPVPNAESEAFSKQRVTGTETETGNRQLTRSGNIGVTTTQQMIESEIELWKWAYLDTIFAQVDSLITCPLYEY